jgi:protein TorT
MEVAADGTKKEIEYSPPLQAKKKWNVCVLIPHLKDVFWKAVDFGAMDEAARLGVKATLYEAGGYENLPRQLSQMDDCMAQGVDAIVIGVVSEAGVAAKIRDAKAKGIVVVGTVTTTTTTADPAVAAYVDVSFYDLGYLAGKSLVAAVKDRPAPVNVVGFPGPQGADWANGGAKGFEAAVANTNIKLLAMKFGDTGKEVQLRLIEDALQTYDKIDGIWAVSTAAEVAPDALQRANRKGILIQGWTATEATIRHVQSGRMMGEESEKPVLESRLSMDLAINALEGALEGKPRPYHLQPVIAILTQETLKDYDMNLSFAPANWQPVFKVN